MMKNSKKTVLIVAMVTLLGCLFAYNYWSFKNGRCTIETLLSMSPLAIVLIICNLFALFWLQHLRLRKKRYAKQQQCECGSQLSQQWGYCPNCGSQRKIRGEIH